MSIGSKVRRMFGPYERTISDLWRSMFIDLSDLTQQLLDWSPTAMRILEIGCGEGGVTERLALAYPDAHILGIDIAGNIGRLYRGRVEGVSFRQIAVQTLAEERSGLFDLIIMCDVMHHIAPSMRAEILAAAGTLLAPSGRFVFKDWVRTTTPIHCAAYVADRWLTGDDVKFLSCAEAQRLLVASFPNASLGGQARIRPWRNNFALLLQS
jgi:2-polyprenyl-3-methyl-5-hydroxy-6-metoxy-1,4-benzoquinol methylase